MRRDDLYQSNAEMCRCQAALPQNASQKERLLKLAEQWMELAEQAKKDPARIRTAMPVVTPSRRHAGYILQG
jgi:hypothetical protein